MSFRKMIYYQQKNNGNKLIYLPLAKALLDELHVYSNTRSLCVHRIIVNKEFYFGKEFTGTSHSVSLISSSAE